MVGVATPTAIIGRGIMPRVACNFSRGQVFSRRHKPPAMKTPLFFIAALVAFFALPFDFTMMASVLFAAALATFMVADYGRGYRPLVPVPVAAQGPERLRLAA